MKIARRLAWGIAGLLAIPVVLILLVLAAGQVAPGRALLVWTAETVSSAVGTPVAIDRMDGSFPFNFEVLGILVSDHKGPYLAADRAHVVWHPMALLTASLSVEKVEVRRVELARLPEPDPAKEPEPVRLPEPPVALDIRQVTIHEIAIAEEIVGIPARFNLSALAKIGRLSDGLLARMDVARVDGVQGKASLALDFDPARANLAVRLALADPSGNLTGQILKTTDPQPMKIDLEGSGPLDNWRGTLKGAIGNAGRLSGEFAIARTTDGRRVTGTVLADIVGLLPAEFQPPLAGMTPQIRLAADIKESGAVTLQALQVASAAADILVRGQIGPQGAPLDLTLRAGIPDGAPLAGLLDTEIAFADLAVEGQITGTAEAPQVTAILSAGDLGLATASAELMETTITAKPVTPLGAPDAAFDVTLDGSLTGIRPTASAGSDTEPIDAKWAIDGRALLAGGFQTEKSRITAGNATIDIAGLFTLDDVDGRVAVSVPDLAPIGAVAGQPLDGTLSLTADVTATPKSGAGSARIDLTGKRLRTGIPQADGLIGNLLRVTGAVERRADGSFVVDDVALRAAKLSMTADGTATADNADVTAEIRMTDLSALDPRLSGTAAINAALTGALKALNADIRVTTKNARAMDRAIRDLALTIGARDVTGNPAATVKLTGRIDNLPVSADLSGRWHQASHGSIDTLKADIGSVHATGQVALRQDKSILGDISLRARDLSDLSAFALTELAGSLEADARFAVEDGLQTTRIKFRADNLSAETIALQSATGNATVVDPLGSPILGGRLKAAGLKVGAERIDAITISASGRPEATEVKANVVAQDIRLDTTTAISIAPERIRADIKDLQAAIRQEPIRLLKPATVTVKGGDVAISNVNLGLRNGRLSVDGTAGEALNLTIDARALPLAIANRFAAGLGIAGSLTAKAQISGTPAAPRGRYSAAIDGLSLTPMRDNGVPALRIRADGTLQGTHTSMKADIRGGKGINLTVNGRLPLAPDRPMSVSTKGTIDLAIANAVLSASGDRVIGKAVIDATAKGTPYKPQMGGSITVSGARFDSRSTDLSLTNIALKVRGNQDKAVIETLTATPAKGGRLSVRGSIGLNPKSGFPVDLNVNLSKAVLIANDIVTAKADAGIAINGPALSAPKVSGAINLRRVEIQLPDQLPGSVVTIPVEHENAPTSIRKRVARDKEKKARANAGPVVGLNLKVRAPNKVFVRGRGLDAELGGILTVTGTSRDPSVVGGFDMLRGKLAVLTQRLDFSKGNVAFSGDLDPELDFEARTKAGDVIAIITVTGPASKPEIGFSSEPDLPQDEVLARLLFDKATKDLSPLQLAQLAAEVAKLAGFIGGGPGALDKIRTAIGVDNIETTTDDDGNLAVKVDKYVTDNIAVGVRQGASADSTAVQVDIDVTDNIKVQSEIDAKGKTRMGIAVEWDY